jgi:hypothetical protein
MGAIVANSAYAENEFSATGGQWYTGASPGTKLPVGGSQTISVLGGAASLTGVMAGSAFRFDSTSTTGDTCLFTQSTTTTTTLDCKALVFHGVTVSGGPFSACTTTSTVTTKELTGVLGMNKAGTLATIKITPKAGAGTAFAVIELAGTCATAGLRKFTGTVFAQAKNATGVFSETQQLSFSEAIQKSAGTATSMKFGEDGLYINGSLEGTAALPWSAKEK